MVNLAFSCFDNSGLFDRAEFEKKVASNLPILRVVSSGEERYSESFGRHELYGNGEFKE